MTAHQDRQNSVDRWPRRPLLTVLNLLSYVFSARSGSTLYSLSCIGSEFYCCCFSYAFHMRWFTSCYHMLRMPRSPSTNVISTLLFVICCFCSGLSPYPLLSSQMVRSCSPFLFFALLIFSPEIQGLILYIKRLPAYMEGPARAWDPLFVIPMHLVIFPFTPAVAGLD